MADAWRNVVDFQAWDTDHDGSVDEAEMRVGVANLFKDLDVNGDGLLDLAEVKQESVPVHCKSVLVRSSV